MTERYLAPQQGRARAEPHQQSVRFIHCNGSTLVDAHLPFAEADALVFVIFAERTAYDLRVEIPGKIPKIPGGSGASLYINKHKFTLAGELAPLQSPTAFAHLLPLAAQRKWVVYTKRPFAGPAQVLTYLSRYTHRVAIDNSRLIALAEVKVTFRWRDYTHGNQTRTMTLEADEFLRRFLLHVLPTSFVRIRYFGLLANRHRAKLLRRCRRYLRMQAPPPLTTTVAHRCQHCHRGTMRRVEILSPSQLTSWALESPPVENSS